MSSAGSASSGCRACSTCPRQYQRAPPCAHMANERLAKGPEGGPDYTETNGAAWMPGFTCGGRAPKVEGEEVVEPFGSDAEQEMSSRAGFTRMLMPGFTCGGRAGKMDGEEVVEPFGSEAEEVSSRAGFTRMLSFWKLVGPMILRYKLVRKLPKGDVRDEELERLQGQSARWAECPSLVPACGGSGQAARHSDSGRQLALWAPSNCLGCSSEPPPPPPFARCQLTNPGAAARQVRATGAPEHPGAARAVREAGPGDLDRADGARPVPGPARRPAERRATQVPCRSAPHHRRGAGQTHRAAVQVDRRHAHRLGLDRAGSPNPNLTLTLTLTLTLIEPHPQPNPNLTPT